MRWAIVLLAIACTGDEEPSVEIPPLESVPERSCEVVLRHTPKVPSLTVEVAGSFSQWEPVAMDGPDDDGEWTLSLGELAPGDYPHKFIYGGKWEDTPRGVRTQWDDGFENRNLSIGDCRRPQVATATVRTPAPDALSVDVQFALAEGGATIDPNSVEITLGGQPITAAVDPVSQRLEIEATGLSAGKHSLRVWARDETGAELEDAPFFLPLWVEEEAFAWQDGLMYFTIVDRFNDADGAPLGAECAPAAGVDPIANLQGGDLKGLTDVLESGYFDDLGVRSFWLNPVVDNPSGGFYDREGFKQFTGFHGYWPIAPRDVETCMGDAEASADDRLRTFVDAAHARGQRVVLDLVLNHVHEDHPWVADHPEWFNQSCVCGTPGCDWDTYTLDCWFTDYLPDLNYRQHAVVNQVVDDVMWWMKTYDIDGFRVDAAKHMDTVILNHLRLRLHEAVTERGGAEVYLVGETYTGDSGYDQIATYIGDDRLHGQFDFPLMWWVRYAFVDGDSLRNLDAAVQRSQEAYGDAWMSVFAGNHDIPRLATQMNGGGWGPWNGTPDYLAEGGGEITQRETIEDMTFALGFVFTQPGVPLLYYGDEIGLAGDGDPDNRRMMQFAPNLSANQSELLSIVQALGQARSASPALQRGDLRTLWVDDSVYVYARTHGDDVAIIVMNVGNGARALDLPLPDPAWSGTTLTPIFGEPQPSATIGETLVLELPPRTMAVYTL